MPAVRHWPSQKKIHGLLYASCKALAKSEKNPWFVIYQLSGTGQTEQNPWFVIYQLSSTGQVRKKSMVCHIPAVKHWPNRTKSMVCHIPAVRHWPSQNKIHSLSYTSCQALAKTEQNPWFVICQLSGTGQVRTKSNQQTSPLRQVNPCNCMFNGKWLGLAKTKYKSIYHQYRQTPYSNIIEDKSSNLL